MAVTDSGGRIRITASAPRKQCAGRHSEGLSLKGMAGTDTESTVTSLSRWQARLGGASSHADRLYTIKDVGDACGLPGPVIMQLVPRTWTDEGWMYTGDQLDASVFIAADLRRDFATATSDAPPAAVAARVDWLVCDRCGAGASADTEAASPWVTGVESSGRVDANVTIGPDFCPRCSGTGAIAGPEPRRHPTVTPKIVQEP